MRYAIALLLIVLCGAVCMAYYVCTPSTRQLPNIHAGLNMMGPAVHKDIGKALDLKDKAHSLLDQALEQDLDVFDIERLVDVADDLLEKAQTIARSNPIPATNMAREAADLYEQVISDLEALLG